jgi:hypothetical protein
MEQDAIQERRPPLPPDVENCHRVIWELFDALLASRAETEKAETEKAEIIRRFFGPRRERFDDPAQGKLFETDGPADADAAEPEAPVTEEQPASPPKKRRHGRRRFQQATGGFAAMTLIFRHNPDAAYYGKTVSPNDKDKVLFRWRLDDGRYEVIFGDLHSETVTAERLRALEGK